MNANELADELYDLDVQASQQSLNDWAEQAATMIRQQQAEIELLKANMNSATKELLQQQDKIAELKHINKNWQISENILLLELEKLQHRELTDEEIEEVIGRHWNKEYGNRNMLTLCRAILKRAQEK